MKKKVIVLLTTGLMMLSSAAPLWASEPICVWIPKGGPHGEWVCPIDGP